MDVKDYRREFGQALAKNAANRRAPNARLGFAFSAGATDTLDLDTLRNLKVLGDEKAEASERMAALHALKAARFAGPRFAPYRAEFLDALRRILTPSEVPELRIEAAEVLATEKDRQTQELLRRGLEDPAQALVPPAEALEFLGYDDHEDAAKLALTVLRSGADLPARESALRVLGGTPEASDVFAAIMTDKSEAKSLRALSAVGLSHADPSRFAELARDVVLDGSDYPDVRATSLGMLAASRGPQTGVDPSLEAMVHLLASPSGEPDALQSAAARWIGSRR